MLELYQAERCPYSETVRETMTELGVSYVIHNPRRPGDEGGDVLNEQTHDELLALADEDTIPFLIDHERGESIADTDAIVEYLDAHYGE